MLNQSYFSVGWSFFFISFFLPFCDVLFVRLLFCIPTEEIINVCMQKKETFVVCRFRWWSGKEFKNVTTLTTPVRSCTIMNGLFNLCERKPQETAKDEREKERENSFLFLILFYATLVFNSDKFKINAFVCVLLDDHWKMCFWQSYVVRTAT